MEAEIIAVGSEMLTPGRLDTNSLWLTERLNRRGIEVARKCVIGDDRRRLTLENKRAREASSSAHCDLICLRATVRSISWSRARYTTPSPPWA